MGNNPEACFSKVPKLFGRFSGDIILFVSSKRRRLEARNFAVIFILIPFTTYEKISCAVCNWRSYVDIVFYISATHLCDHGGCLSFNQSQPDLRVFLLVLWFSSLSKIDSQSKTSGLGDVLQDHTFGSSHCGTFHFHSADPVELCPS